MGLSSCGRWDPSLLRLMLACCSHSVPLLRVDVGSSSLVEVFLLHVGTVVPLLIRCVA
jgi:hypothetical protein